MVRCPRADRVAVPSAMIHLLSCGTVDHGRLVWSRQLGADRPPKSVSVSNSLFFLAMRLSTDKINRKPEAIAYYTGCLALRPNDSITYRNRGACYFELGQLDDAIADTRQAVRLAPNDMMSRFNLG